MIITGSQLQGYNSKPPARWDTFAPPFTKGRVFDNIFSERLWRTVKVEDVYLRDYQTVTEARFNLGRYFEFYNNQRLHEALGYRTPAEVYGTAVGTPVALRAPSVPTATIQGDESTLESTVFCLDNG